jgi:ATP-dependent DNA helicase DinG
VNATNAKGSIDKYFEIDKNGISEEPFDVEEFFQMMKESHKSIVFSSATLLAFGKTDHFTRFFGDFKIDKVVDVGGVFDFSKNMQLFTQFSPDRTRDKNEYIAKLARLTRKMHDVANSGEGILVLFNSKQDLELAVEVLGELNIYQQHEVAEYKEDDRKKVLFGLASLWTGLDLKGKHLKYFVIAGMPFGAPTSEAKKMNTYIEETMKVNSFTEYAVPVALEKLVQGVGRLIRTVTDSGVVVILDGNLASGRTYWAQRVKGWLGKVYTTPYQIN